MRSGKQQGEAMKKAQAAKAARLQELGQLLRSARRERQWVLREVAERAGLKVPFLCDIERGKRPVGVAKLEKLCEVLKMPQDAVARCFQLRGRLPPSVEKHFLKHPNTWPSRKNKET